MRLSYKWAQKKKIPIFVILSMENIIEWVTTNNELKSRIRSNRLYLMKIWQPIFALDRNNSYQEY